jgi:hypothetical protein
MILCAEPAHRFGEAGGSELKGAEDPLILSDQISAPSLASGWNSTMISRPPRRRTTPPSVAREGLALHRGFDALDCNARRTGGGDDFCLALDEAV